MRTLSSVRRLQYSVLMAGNEGDARAAARLAEYYGADTVVFRCERLISGGGGSIDYRVVSTTV